jgi:hypothetical protein
MVGHAPPPRMMGYKRRLPVFCPKTNLLGALELVMEDVLQADAFLLPFVILKRHPVVWATLPPFVKLQSYLGSTMNSMKYGLI